MATAPAGTPSCCPGDAHATVRWHMEAMYRSGRDVAHTVALLTRGQALYMRSEEFYKSSVVRVSRSRGHLASSRRMVQNFATRKPDVVRALIRQKIRLGRLPVHSFPILTGGPGGECAQHAAAASQ